MHAKKYLFSLGLVLCSAASAYFVKVGTAQQPAVQSTADVQYQTGAVLYMQKAAEYRALAFQAFNLARWKLDADLDKKNVKKLPKAEQKRSRAIVVDIDETVLDNSPSQAYGIKNKVPFSPTEWYRWGEMRKAKAIPGSVEFLNYATSKGVKIFYVSNRDEVQKQATIDNLKGVGFNDITGENVVLRTGPSTKEPRRSAIAEKYRIVFLMGDNLDDFSNVFERKSVIDRFAETEKVKDLWGYRFIVLPNAMYGTWESAIYEYKSGLSEADKSRIRSDALELP